MEVLVRQDGQVIESQEHLRILSFTVGPENLWRGLGLQDVKMFYFMETFIVNCRTVLSSKSLIVCSVTIMYIISSLTNSRKKEISPKQ